MRCKEFRHEYERPHSSLFVISFLCIFISAAALGSLRLYGLYLEHRISETANRIEVCAEKNLVMSRQYSQLLSPARIYSYAREKLGMMNAEDVKTVKLYNTPVAVARVSVEEANGEKGLLDQLNPIVKKAHAKN